MILAALAALASCAKGLDTRATVRFSTQTDDASLTSAASKLAGMTLVQDVTPEFWGNAIKKDKTDPNPPDLYVAEWGRELSAAEKDGAFAHLASLWPRTGASKRMPAFSASIHPTPEEGFIPSEVSIWGLFYSRILFDKLGAPEIRDMDGLAALLDAAKKRGIVPIALGSAFGWPGAAWLTCVDMRRNGGKTAWERVMGLRPFDDAEGIAAAKILAVWRDAGFFSPDAARAGMEESVSAVENGRALLVLMDSSAVERMADPSKIGFMEIPFWNGRGEPRGEMGSVTGFAVSASSRSPGAALALVDAYLTARSVRASVERHALPILSGGSVGDTLQGVQSRALGKAKWLIPSQDRIMSAQFVQDSIKIWSAFFDRSSVTDGAALAGALQALSAGNGGSQ
jgi:ABC-type glycerol-3-phosphate transport system substrate-binding protein